MRDKMDLDPLLVSDEMPGGGRRLRRLLVLAVFFVGVAIVFGVVTMMRH